MIHPHLYISIFLSTVVWYTVTIGNCNNILPNTIVRLSISLATPPHTRTQNELKEVVEDAVDVLRENFTGSIQNLHRDFLRQFQRQADDTEKMFERQQTEIERLVKDNMMLREERKKNCRRF